MFKNTESSSSGIKMSVVMQKRYQDTSIDDGLCVVCDLFEIQSGSPWEPAAGAACGALDETEATAESRSSAWLKSQSAARSKLPWHACKWQSCLCPSAVLQGDRQQLNMHST